MTSFPNAEKGSFEDENGDWCRHVSTGFVNNVTMPMLEAPGCDPAHAAVAHLNGAIICAMAEAGGRGGTTVAPELLKRFREALIALGDETIEVEVGGKVMPFLTVLPGGKEG